MFLRRTPGFALERFPWKTREWEIVYEKQLCKQLGRKPVNIMNGKHVISLAAKKIKATLYVGLK
jgi:hypothetical protein